jgi:hypothetical protein
MTREYARGPSGDRVVGVVPRSRGTILTVFGTIGLDGVRAMMAYEGGTSAEAFLRFAPDALAPSLRRGDVVVMDNLGAHRAVGSRPRSKTSARVPATLSTSPFAAAWTSSVPTMPERGSPTAGTRLTRSDQRCDGLEKRPGVGALTPAPRGVGWRGRHTNQARGPSDCGSAGEGTPPGGGAEPLLHKTPLPRAYPGAMPRPTVGHASHMRLCYPHAQDAPDPERARRGSPQA